MMFVLLRVAHREVGESDSLSPTGQEVIIKVDFTTHIETITVDANKTNREH
jgi:hypothetical protein